MKTMVFKGKKILLIYAKFFNYDIIVRNKLLELGAIVDLYDGRANLRPWEKALKKVYRGYYVLKQKRFHAEIQRLKKEENYDYIFSNTYLPAETIKGYRDAFPNAKMILYLDDSVANLKGVERTFYLYDKVATFDRLDALNYNVNLVPLFFSDDYNNKALSEKNNYDYDICFVGTIHSDRLKIILDIDKQCEKNNLCFYNYCYLQSHFIYYYYLLTKKEFRKKPKSFFRFDQISSEKVAEILSSSKSILDIQHPKQTGLTMRTIETIGSQKKLLTTNEDVVNYDLYDERNIRVIDRQNPIVDIDFINNDFRPLSDEIKSKYSTEGWLQQLFK